MTTPVVAYMAMVFRRSAIEITPGMYEWPSGGSYLDPCPTNEMWTRVPLPGVDPLYMSMRIFTNNGLPPQQDLWSPPVLLVKHGDKGDTGSSGAAGQPAPIVPGPKGDAGINGANGVSPVGMHWVGSLPYPPSNPASGAGYYNTTEKKSYIFYDGAWYQMTVDGLDGVNGQDGLAIIWKGNLATPPENPAVNWVYRDSDNGVVYIWNGLAWEVMILDGDSGYHNANVLAYKRSATMPEDIPGVVTYHFATGNWTADPLTPTMNGWSQSIPASNGEPLWVTAATANSLASTDIIESTDWSAPVCMAIDGTEGAPGDSIDIVFCRAAHRPATPAPSINTPIGWYSDIDTVPPSNDPMWFCIGTKNLGVSEYTWQTPLKIEGQDGQDGIAGLSVVELTIYQRASSEPETPNGGAFSFDSQTLTTVPSGWSIAIPDGTDPVYTSRAVVSQQGITGTVSVSFWTPPVLSLKNGQDGLDGLNIATVYIYKRTTTAGAPDVPTAQTTYTFSSGSLAGLNNGWSTVLPVQEENEKYLWVSVATAVSKMATDTLEASEWQPAQKLAQDGIDGTHGIAGRTVSLAAASNIITYDTNNANPAPATAVITATAFNTFGTVFYEFLLEGGSVQNTTANTYVYTPSNSYANMPDVIQVKIREEADNNPVLATDQITISAVKPGTSAITIEITNEAHVLYRDKTGVVNYAGSGTDIRVWEGATPLTYATSGVRTFSIGTPANVNIVAGPRTTVTKNVTNDTARFDAASSLTAGINTASITFPVTARRADGTSETFDVVQSIAVTNEGADGNPATYVVITGPQAFKFLGGAAVPVDTSIMLTATLFGGLTGPLWQYYTDSAWANLSGTNDTLTYDLAYNNAAWGTKTALRIRCIAGGEYTEVTVTKNYDGASVFIVYHNNPANNKPAKPATAAGTDNNWYTSPTSAAVWISQKVGNIADNTWGEPIRIQGQDAVALQLSPETCVLQANADGTGYNLAAATGMAGFYVGATKLTTGVTFSGTITKNGLTFTVNADGSFFCSGSSWTSDREVFEVGCTYNGTLYVRPYTISKILAGSEQIDTPTTPTGFIVSGAYATLLLQWDVPTYSGHATTEIWRHIVDVRASATLVAKISGNTYSDKPPNTSASQNYYYWIRHVNRVGDLGNFQATNGTVGATASDPSYLLERLAGELGYEQFDVANGVFPIRVISDLPTLPDITTWPAGSMVYLTTDGKLYRTDGATWTKAIDGADVTAETITAAKFAPSIEPVTLVTSVPTIKSTGTVFNTTDGKLYRWDGSAYIATVPTGDLFGTITAGQIAAGAINASHIAAGAITADKVLIGSATNLIVNPNFEIAGSSAAIAAGWSHDDSVRDTAIFYNGSASLRQNANGTVNDTYSDYIAVSPDEEYYFEVWARTSAAIGGGDFRPIFIEFRDANKANPSWVTGASLFSAVTTWTKYTYGCVVPAGKYYMRVGVSARDTATSGSVYVDGYFAHKKTPATLIADGAITTDKLAANSVEAGKIAAGAILASHVGTNEIIANTANIKNAVITSAKIGSVNADTITTGTLNADRIGAGTITAAKYAELRQSLYFTGEDSVDNLYFLDIPFKIPSELNSIVSIKLSFKLLPFRSYSTTVSSGGGHTTASGGSGTSGATAAAQHSHNFTFATGGTGSTYCKVTSDGVLYSGNVSVHWVQTSSSADGHTHTLTWNGGTTGSDVRILNGGFSCGVAGVGGLAIVTTSAANGHAHSFLVQESSSGSLVVPYLSDYSVRTSNAIAPTLVTPTSANAHTHTTPSHAHAVSNHTHPLGFGIYEEALVSPSVIVHTANNDTPTYTQQLTYTASQTDIDMTAHFSTAGWKHIKLVANKRMRIAYVLEVKVDIDA